MLEDENFDDDSFDDEHSDDGKDDDEHSDDENFDDELFHDENLGGGPALLSPRWRPAILPLGRAMRVLS